MRTLKLQMQVSIDGFVAGPNGELDWMTWEWDERLKSFVSDLTDASDTILLGRKMTDGFMGHWTKVGSNPKDESYDFAIKMLATPKVVFSRTLSESAWVNTELASNVTGKITELKRLSGGDIVAYGGAGFVSSLVRADLIDDYYLFINPAAIGTGMTIFAPDYLKRFDLIGSTAYECGVVVNHYRRT